MTEEEMELVLDDGILKLAKEESKITFYLDEESILNLLVGIKKNQELGDIIEGKPISMDGVSDGFLVRLQELTNMEEE